MGSMMSDLGGIHSVINKLRVAKGAKELDIDEMLVKLFDEVAYVWPRVGSPPVRRIAVPAGYSPLSAAHNGAV